jgi:hypothetical protein
MSEWSWPETGDGETPGVTHTFQRVEPGLFKPSPSYIQETCSIDVTKQRTIETEWSIQIQITHSCFCKTSQIFEISQCLHSFLEHPYLFWLLLPAPCLSLIVSISIVSDAQIQNLEKNWKKVRNLFKKDSLLWRLKLC